MSLSSNTLSQIQVTIHIGRVVHMYLLSAQIHLVLWFWRLLDRVLLSFEERAPFDLDLLSPTLNLLNTAWIFQIKSGLR